MENGCRLFFPKQFTVSVLNATSGLAAWSWTPVAPFMCDAKRKMSVRKKIIQTFLKILEQITNFNWNLF